METNRLTWPYRFLFLLVFSVALMIVDHRSPLLQPLRNTATVLNVPFQGLLHLPAAVRGWVDAYYPNAALHREYAALQAERLALEVRLQRYDALRVENERLAKLLGMVVREEVRGMLAQIVDIGLRPFTGRLAINRGLNEEIYVGQPVITTDGVLGQVSGVGVNRSVVTPITDPTHALPVQVQRNGLHTIIRGAGDAELVEAPFLPTQADIRVGDVFVTSGLGGGFPPGYKVARVREVVGDANQAFLNVQAMPFADILYTREALLLFIDSGLEEEGDVGDEVGDEE